MPGYYYLDDNAEPVQCESVTDPKSVAMWNTPAGRLVAGTERNDVRVSTVFLALDYSFGQLGPPILWESMVFGGEHDQHQERYSSREDAELGHLALVSRVWPENAPDTKWGPASRRTER